MTWLKQAHVLFALTSLVGFVLRGYWMIAGSPRLQRRWVQVAPHFVDTFLLLSGVWLVLASGLYPTQQPWLAAKLVALVFYIVLGSLALKRGKTRAIRLVAFVAALGAFAYISSAALTRQPLPAL